MISLPIFLFLLGSADFQWSPVETGSLISNLKVTGRIIPQEGASSIESARVQGRVTQILKREGELVQEGTPIFVINSADCISLIQEKANAEKLKLPDLIEAAGRREKQLGLSTLSGQCKILASHAGTLTKRQIELGATFNVGDPLATIVDIRRLMVELDIPESNLFAVKVGQQVSFELASYPGQKFATSIKGILPYIDAATRTSKARLAAVALPPGTTPDFLVFGEIQTGGEQAILKVPSSALVFNKDRQFVIRDGSPQPTIVPVEVLDESDNFSFVRTSTSGELSEGDEVASKGAIFLFRKLHSE